MSWKSVGFYDGVYNRDSESYYGLILESWDLTPPTPNNRLVEIPGNSIILDYSNAISGYPSYGVRRVIFNFGVVGSYNDRLAKARTFFNAVHGVRTQIRPSWINGYLEGRCTVTAFDETEAGDHSSIILECLCNPYIISETETIVTSTITGTVATQATLTNNGAMPAEAKVDFTGGPSAYVTDYDASPRIDYVVYPGGSVIVRPRTTGVWTFRYTSNIATTGDITFTFREGNL